jgi:hypothetical protein
VTAGGSSVGLDWPMSPTVREPVAAASASTMADRGLREAYGLSVSTTRVREFAEVLGAADARQIRRPCRGMVSRPISSRPTSSRRPV